MLKQETVDKIVKFAEDKFEKKWSFIDTCDTISRIVLIICCCFVSSICIWFLTEIKEYTLENHLKSIMFILLDIEINLLLYFIIVYPFEKMLDGKKNEKQNILLNTELIEAKTQKIITENEFNEMCDFLSKTGLIDGNVRDFVNYHNQRKKDILNQLNKQVL